MHVGLAPDSDGLGLSPKLLCAVVHVVSIVTQLGKVMYLFLGSQLQPLCQALRTQALEILMEVLLVSRCVGHIVLASTQEQHRFLLHTEDDAFLVPVLLKFLEDPPES